MFSKDRLTEKAFMEHRIAMDFPDLTELKYSILNPTGNITALAESPAAPGTQPAIAARIMERHPEVEQVGFVAFDLSGQDPDLPAEDPQQIHGSLRMAGGEFCGNASMCAAVLYVLRRNISALPDSGSLTVRLRVSGASQPVEVRLKQDHSEKSGSGNGTSGLFRCRIAMPPAIRTESVPFSFRGLSEDLPVVFMQGISHVIIEKKSVFYGLLNNKQAAEEAVRAFCGCLSSDGLGLMFLDGDRLIPLVYVPGSDTVFWENSCASGTTAAGIRLALQSGKKADISFKEPGGILRIESDPFSGASLLHGQVQYLRSFTDTAAALS